MNTITTVAWGIPVNICRSIAHMVAFVEHSVATDAFTECVQRGAKRQAAIGKLPAEIINMILVQAKPCLETRRIQWNKLLQCCTNDCVWLSPYHEHYVLPIDWLVRSHKNEFHEDHRNTRRRILEVVGDRGRLDQSEDGTLAQYNKVLFRNLGLQMDFTVGMDAQDSEGIIEIFAHLIKPSERQRSKLNNRSPSYASSAMIVDPLMLEEPLDGLRTLFGTAMRVLELEVMCSEYHVLPKEPTLPITQEPSDEDDPFLNDHRAALNTGEWPKLMVISHSVHT